MTRRSRMALRVCVRACVCVSESAYTCVFMFEPERTGASF